MQSIAQVYGVIYSILNENTGWLYIGQTVQAPLARWSQHRSELTTKTHGNSHLRSSWVKHGEEAFTFVVLEEVDTQEALDEAERFYIEYFHYCGVQLYNYRPGGSGKGKRLKPYPPLSAEARRKRSEYAKEHGHGFTDEAKEKARQLSIGRVKTAHEKAKWRESNLPRMQSAEYREWLSRTLKGKKKSQYVATEAAYAKWEAQRGVKENPDKTKRRIDAAVSKQPIRRFRSPDGQIYETRNVVGFAREHGLRERQMSYLAKGQCRQHRGWTLVE